MAEPITPIRLRDFNGRISRILQSNELRNCWIIADLSDVSVRNGHCYFDLIDRDEGVTTPVAKMRAIIWGSQFVNIRANFERITGQRFESGIKVMVLASVNFHPSYGISLIVTDVNPEFTIGEIERKRREILHRLNQEGVINMNKELVLPSVPQRIAIISSDGAAGYGDFMNQLNNNSSGFKFYTVLYSAVMQGKDTPKTIIQALNRIVPDIDKFDCVVIIRGGGSTADLNSFDDYDLALNVAQFPLPIITGIGHERDNTVLDYISCLRVKTPTAAAEWLVSQAQNVMDKLNSQSQMIVALAREFVSGAKEQLRYYSSSIPLFAKTQIERRNASLREYGIYLSNRTNTLITSNTQTLEHYKDTIKQIIPQSIKLEKMRLRNLYDNVNNLSPLNTLKRGYSITQVNGKSLSSISHIKLGDEITTVLKDGKIISNITSKYIENGTK